MGGHKAAWLDGQQREVVHTLACGWLWRSELPTWLLIATVYGGWFLTLANWQALGLLPATLLPATLLLIWFTTWYLSVQHELIHGHPTRWPAVNHLLGCDEYRYSSFMVARLEDAQNTLEDFLGRRAVCNSADSQSGFNALQNTVAPLARRGRFFSDVILSGSHRQSLVALQQDSVDLAAIDCVSWALFMRHEPDELENLIVIGQTPLTPGLPLITSSRTTPEVLAALRSALHRLVTDPACQAVREALFIAGFSQPERREYAEVVARQPAP
ncbi:PhnD/SsuA/transferrin family substrate-binding protein [Dryocola sp. LX212]